MKHEPIYNTIGKTYDVTRNPDPTIVKTLLDLLSLKKNGHYLDIACGSGNYTAALAKTGIDIEGIDISNEMLSKAQIKESKIKWHLGDAKALPFQNNSFDGAICTLATHHIESFECAFKEAYRVIKNGRFVILTSTPEQMKNYWLWHYFPMMMKDASSRMSSFSYIEKAYLNAGFINIKQERFFVTDKLTDWFLHSGKYRPHIYLDPKVRAGISSFHVSSNENEIENGLSELQKDIATGAVKEIIQQYESDTGDYLFMTGDKN